MIKCRLVLFLLLSTVTFSQNIKVSSGSIETIEAFQSKYVDARQVDVWLPNGYSKKKKYPVLYLHDGKMLFDAEITWNRKSWEVDEVAGKLMQENKIKNCIIVGIHNNGDYRHSEYFPEKVIQNIPEAARKIIVEESLKNKPQADNYLRFIVSELKPFIDKKYATLKNQQNTFMCGASMGGLISLYAICEYPDVFGAVACISTHSPMISKIDFRYDIDKDIASKFRDYLKLNLPNPKNHKIYMDYGDKSIDAYYQPFQEKIDVILKEKGYTNKNWVTKFFPGESHSETSWNKRLDIPLTFLLGK